MIYVTITLVTYLKYYLRTRTLSEINSLHQVDDVIYQLHSSRGIRQGNYCNNLATRVIPYIFSKSAIGETILKTLLPHFSWGPCCLDTSNIRIYIHHKFFFPTMPKLYTLGFSLCREQFLTKYNGFKMQGKWDTCHIQSIVTSTGR